MKPFVDENGVGPTPVERHAHGRRCDEQAQLHYSAAMLLRRGVVVPMYLAFICYGLVIWLAVRGRTPPLWEILLWVLGFVFIRGASLNEARRNYEEGERLFRRAREFLADVE